jgi:hypothetical protein
LTTKQDFAVKENIIYLTKREKRPFVIEHIIVIGIISIKISNSTFTAMIDPA